MYFVSGYIMVHESWFGRENEAISPRSVSLEPSDISAAPDSETFALWLQARVGLRGQPSLGQRQGNGEWVFYVERPGMNYKVLLSRDLTSANITGNKTNWTAAMHGFHRLHGYRGGLLYLAWAFVYDLASLAMILFGITGVYMWYVRTKRRTLGWVLLAAGFAYTTGTIIYLMVAR